MRKRTVWALVGLTSLGALAIGLDRTAAADAGVRDEGAEQQETTTKDAAAPIGGGQQEAQSGASAPSEEACPTTEAAKLNMVLRSLHMLNRSEIEHARIAEERSKQAEVKEFARRMISDHTEADRKLTEFAKKNGVSLTAVTPTDPIHAALHASMKTSEEALKAAKGDSFDAAYLGMEIAEHRLGVSTVQEGQKYAKGEAKQLLDESHKMLRGHLEHAERLGQRLRFEPLPVGGGPEQGERREAPTDAGALESPAIEQWVEDAGRWVEDAGRQLLEGDGGDGSGPVDTRPPPIERGRGTQPQEP